VRYIRDPARDEPRNVGIIAWAEGRVVARFLGEDEQAELDLRRVPSAIIGDRQTYREWVRFLRQQLDAQATRKISLEDESFLAALAQTARGNYELRLGAEAYADASLSLERTTAEAFARLVTPDVDAGGLPEEPLEKGATHRKLAYDAYLELRRSQWREEQDFVRHYRVVGRTRRGGEVPAVFDLGVLPQEEGLFGSGRKLLVDAVALTAPHATPEQVDEIIDRARAVAAKAIEIATADRTVLVRALVGRNGEAKTGKEVAAYALRVLRDEGGVETITLGDLLEIVPRVRDGRV
jgi:hypothetical protein